MFYIGKPMKTEPVKDVLNSFIDWLPNDAQLVAHNCKKFDANIIVSHYQNHDLINKLKEKVTGFSDTLPLFQQKILNLRSYSQTSLATEILRQTYDAHNTKEDVTLLQQLITSVNPTTDDILRFSFSVKYVQEYLEHFEMKKVNVITFNGMVRDKIMTKTMCEKAATNGITFNHLKCVFARNGYDGLYSIMSEEVDKKPRVIKQKKIIERISNYFSRLKITA